MKSPVRWLTDKEYTANPLEIRALILAHTELGVQEEPRSSNWGERVRQYLRSAGIGVPAPWCGAFVTWCLKQAGAGSQLGRQVKYPASTWWWYEWAVKAGRLYGKPQRGDIFVWSTPRGGHMGWVAQVYPDGSFRTIEGNSNDAGDREGYEVCERKRTGLPFVTRRGFIRLSGVKW